VLNLPLDMLSNLARSQRQARFAAASSGVRALCRQL
jgi:hypothetical protein